MGSVGVEGGELVVELGVLSLGEPQATCQSLPQGSHQEPGSGRGAKSHSGGPCDASSDECRVLTDRLDLSKGAVECVAREQSMVMKSDDVRSGSVFALILDG